MAVVGGFGVTANGKLLIANESAEDRRRRSVI